MEKGNQPSSGDEAAMPADGGATATGFTPAATAAATATGTDPRFWNDDGSHKTGGQLRDEARDLRTSAVVAGGDLGGGIRASFNREAAEFEAAADAWEAAAMSMFDPPPSS